MYKLLAFLFILSSCMGVNSTQKAFQNRSSKSSSYITMSKARYEEIYHRKNNSKYTLQSNTKKNNAHTDELALVWPTSGVLTSAFGYRTLRHRKQMHSGIDIAAQVGTPVYASETGRVVFTGTRKGYGKAIILRHDAIHETLYGHLNRSIVKSNQVVHRNQLIGYVGRTGHVTGANLHFETRVNGIPKNPLNFLPDTFGKDHIYIGTSIPPYHRAPLAAVPPKKDKKS